jgi:hypothetical protein
MLTLLQYTREIPMIPQYRYTVCCGVPNTKTIPVPVVPVTQSLQVFLYLCRTLGAVNIAYYIQTQLPYTSPNRHLSLIPQSLSFPFITSQIYLSSISLLSHKSYTSSHILSVSSPDIPPRQGSTFLKSPTNSSECHLWALFFYCCPPSSKQV